MYPTFQNFVLSTESVGNGSKLATVEPEIEAGDPRVANPLSERTVTGRAKGLLEFPEVSRSSYKLTSSSSSSSSSSDSGVFVADGSSAKIPNSFYRD